MARLTGKWRFVFLGILILWAPLGLAANEGVVDPQMVEITENLASLMEVEQINRGELNSDQIGIRSKNSSSFDDLTSMKSETNIVNSKSNNNK